MGFAAFLFVWFASFFPSYSSLFTVHCILSIISNILIIFTQSTHSLCVCLYCFFFIYNFSFALSYYHESVCLLWFLFVLFLFLSDSIPFYIICFCAYCIQSVS